MSIKVFFNESCSICKKEIDIYRKMENNLEWYDIKEKESQITNLNTDKLTKTIPFRLPAPFAFEADLFLK